MRTSVHARGTDHRFYHYGENFLCRDPENGGPVMLRRGRTKLGAAFTAEVRWVGGFTKADGTELLVLLRSDNATGGNPEIYTWNGAAWVLTVTTAQLAAAGVTGMSQGTISQVGTAVLANNLIVADGARPWMWDGTAGGGVTSLTNAPATTVVGQPPVVYYGKVFFITPTKMVWSEENQPNTGYESGGFNNAWTLSQTSQAKLTGLAATNSGLFYFRANSIGVIRGAVTPDFTSSGVHDAVSQGVGSTLPKTIVSVGEDVWFQSARGRIHCIASGKLLDVTPSSGYVHNFTGVNEYKIEPFVYGTGLLWDSGQVLNRACVMPALEDERPTVQFLVQTDAGGAHTVLVFDAATRRAHGWFFFGGSGFTFSQRILGASSTRALYTTEGQFVYSIDNNSSTVVDDTDTGGTDGIEGWLMGPPMFNSDDHEWHFDRADVVVWAPVQTDADVVFSFGYLTSRLTNIGTGESPPGQKNQTFSGRTIGHLSWGLNTNARWIRPVLVVTPPAGSSRGRLGVEGYTITAYPESFAPGVR